MIFLGILIGFVLGLIVCFIFNLFARFSFKRALKRYVGAVKVGKSPFHCYSPTVSLEDIYGEEVNNG